MGVQVTLREFRFVTRKAAIDIHPIRQGERARRNTVAVVGTIGNPHVRGSAVNASNDSGGAQRPVKVASRVCPARAIACAAHIDVNTRVVARQRGEASLQPRTLVATAQRTDTYRVFGVVHQPRQLTSRTRDRHRNKHIILGTLVLQLHPAGPVAGRKLKLCRGIRHTRHQNVSTVTIRGDALPRNAQIVAVPYRITVAPQIVGIHIGRVIAYVYAQFSGRVRVEHVAV